MPDTPAARRWRKLANEFDQSSLTLPAFAKARGVNPRTLAWWRSRLKQLDAKQPDAPAFTEMVVVGPDPTVVLALDALPAHIVVDRQTDLALLRRLLEAFA